MIEAFVLVVPIAVLLITYIGTSFVKASTIEN